MKKTLFLIGFCLVLSAFAQAQQVTVKHAELPQYPGDAFEKNVAGNYSIEVNVDDRGNITVMREVGHPVFKQASMQALKRWVFVCNECKPGAQVKVWVGFNYSTGDASCVDSSSFDAPASVAVSKCHIIVQPYYTSPKPR